MSHKEWSEEYLNVPPPLCQYSSPDDVPCARPGGHRGKHEKADRTYLWGDWRGVVQAARSRR